MHNETIDIEEVTKTLLNSKILFTQLNQMERRLKEDAENCDEIAKVWQDKAIEKRKMIKVIREVKKRREKEENETGEVV